MSLTVSFPVKDMDRSNPIPSFRALSWAAGILCH